MPRITSGRPSVNYPDHAQINNADAVENESILVKTSPSGLSGLIFSSGIQHIT
jgi:hypothetical protein